MASPALAGRVAARLDSVRRRVEEAGRSPGEIAIVAVTKGHPPEVCRAAITAGLDILGENRVQEALVKMAEVEGAQWHLIGHLQTNKANHAKRFTLVQSLDSLPLAEVLARRARVPVLLEVNVAGDVAKHGVAPDQAVVMATQVDRLLELRGLMGMGPAQGDPGPAFRQLRRLRDEAQQRLGKPLPILSMGMSGDFEVAVREGSTMLRLGTVLFGPRPTKTGVG
jgi:pyridoxal phosphate enzyme (YggS family)